MSEKDMDLSGGLMEKIQKLIAPPVSEEAKVKKKEGLDLHPYYKRPGKGHNHDSCDSCKEGGDLLCCDKCPASFHLICNDPPLDENDIPMGQWICHRCKVKEMRAKEKEVDSNKRKIDEDFAQPSSSKAKTSKSEEALIRPESNNERERRAKERAVKRLTTNTSPKPTQEFGKIKCAFDKLIKFGEETNPITFKLPPEYSLTLLLPGDDKIQMPGKVGNSRRSSASRKKPYERDPQGLVPLPAKVCFYCKKSCAKAILIACDYCSNLFHMDCLDPPLTFPPTGMWSCPTHVRPYIDDVLWKGAGFTERVNLYKQYAPPTIDEHKIKIDFCRKVYQKRYIPFHQKNLRKAMQVPEFVKEAYKNPVQKQPSQLDLVRAAVMYERQEEQLKEKHQEKARQYLATPDEQIVALEAALMMNIEAINEVKKKKKQAVRNKAEPNAENNTKEEDETIENVESKATHIVNGCILTAEERDIYAATSSIKENPQKLLDALTVIVLKEHGKLSNGDADSNSELEEYGSNRQEAGEAARYPALNNIHPEDANSHEEETINNAAENVNHSEKTNEECIENNTEKLSKEVNDAKEDANKEEKQKSVQNDIGEVAVKPELMDVDPDNSETNNLTDESAIEEMMDTLSPEIIRFLALQQLKQQMLHSNTVLESAPRPAEIPNGMASHSSVEPDNNDSDIEMNRQAFDIPRHQHQRPPSDIIEVNRQAIDIPRPQHEYKKPPSDIIEMKREAIDIPRPIHGYKKPPTKSFNYKMKCSKGIRGLLVPNPSKTHSEAVTLKTDTLVIGKEKNQFVEMGLSKFGDCSKISNVHASIVFNEGTKTYRLINFSEHGTIIDGNVYGLNLAQERQVEKPSRLRKNIESIKKLRGRRKAVMNAVMPTNMTPPEAEKEVKLVEPVGEGQCSCNHTVPAASYEGPATLRHGSEIQFGCLKFTFSYPHQTEATSSKEGLHDSGPS